MDDAMILIDEIYRIQRAATVTATRNINFVNCANYDVVVHVINNSKLERQNIKYYHQINISFVITC
jgi:hypothetical protein